MRRAVLVVHDRERLTPVALAGEQPVAQFVLDGALAVSVGFQPSDHGRLRLFDGQTVQVVGVHQRAVTGVGRGRNITAGNDFHDRQAEDRGEFPVALIVSGHGHDRAGAVTGQHVVGDEDRHLRAVHRVGRVGTQEDSGLLLVLLTLQIRFGRDRLAVRRNGFRGVTGILEGPARIDAGGPFLRGQPVDQLVLGRQDHIRGTEQGVRPGGEDLDPLTIGIEFHLRATGSSDPVALHGLYVLWPVQAVQIVDEPVGVGGDAHHPLPQPLPEYREVAALTAAVSGDLFVGQHRAQAGAPVDHRIRLVHQAVRVQYFGAFGRGQILPGAAVGRRPGAGVELCLQFRDRAGAIQIPVVPSVVNAQEDPLRPLVVLRIRGRERAPPVMAETEPVQLTLHGRDIRFGGLARMCTGLHRVLFGGQTERVVTQRVQHVAAVHPVIAREDIGGDVAEGMPDVQTRTGRVREHVLDEQLIRRCRTRERSYRVRRVECPALIPGPLPPALDATGEAGVVPVLRCIAFGCTSVRHGPAFFFSPIPVIDVSIRVERPGSCTENRAGLDLSASRADGPRHWCPIVTVGVAEIARCSPSLCCRDFRSSRTISCWAVGLLRSSLVGDRCERCRSRLVASGVLDSCGGAGRRDAAAVR